MLVDPPIDKLVEKIGCKYALVCLVTKRARELQQKIGDENAIPAGTNPISYAATEVYEGNVEPVYED
mgnify:FL=1